MSPQVAVPELLWAQRSSAAEPERNLILLTINVPNLTEEHTKCDLTPTGLHFEATVETDSSRGIVGHKYNYDLEFYDDIVPDKSQKHLTAKSLYLVLRKEKAQEEYWPRLTKPKARLHHVKTDFGMWEAEAEQTEDLNDPTMAGGFDPSMLQGMGGMGGLDLQSMMAQMGGSGMEGLNDMQEEDASDDEEPAKISEA